MMFSEELPDIAVIGERGIDVFQREEDSAHNRSRFRCLGTVSHPEPGAPANQRGAVQSYLPIAAADPDRLYRAAARLNPGGAEPSPAMRGLRLGDARSYPLLGGGEAALGYFLHIDFLRAWTLADLGLTTQSRALESAPAAMIAAPGPLLAAIEQAYEFNRISAGAALAGTLLTALRRNAPPSGALPSGERGGPAVPEALGWGLRMLGDLCLRGGRARLALLSFEAAIEAGDNPHRRGRALAAARALGDAAALARHEAANERTPPS